MASTTGERQVSKFMKGIAPNHRSRYFWAVDILKTILPPGARVLDAASGIGYGSLMLAEAGFEVTAVDLHQEAVDYQPYFTHPLVRFIQGDILDIDDSFDAVVTIETIEHIKEDQLWVDLMAGMTNIVVATVPNQNVVPFNPDTHRWHERHYTQKEVRGLFSGWELSHWATQYGKWERHAMTPGQDGMTLGFLAQR